MARCKSNPLGSWNFYEIPAQNNGTQGTPDHGCDGGFCFGDFPHIGADANSVVLTTNEYSFFGNDYNGVQIYALSKADLVAGVSSPTMVYLQNQNVPALGQGGFTAWPAQSSPSSFDSSNGGTEYLVSSTAGDGFETGNTSGGSDKMVVWALTNTSSLDTTTPDLGLQQAVVTTIPYVLPPKSFMRSSQGPLALLQCLNLGTSCPALNVSDPPFIQPGPYPLDSSDTRVLSSFFQDGVLWTTLGTGLQGTGGSSYEFANNLAQVKLDTKAGIAYFALRPTWTESSSGGEGLTASDATLDTTATFSGPRPGPGFQPRTSRRAGNPARHSPTTDRPGRQCLPTSREPCAASGPPARSSDPLAQASHSRRSLFPAWLPSGSQVHPCA